VVKLLINGVIGHVSGNRTNQDLTKSVRGSRTANLAPRPPVAGANRHESSYFYHSLRAELCSISTCVEVSDSRIAEGVG
jgi:hypothetical protein